MCDGSLSFTQLNFSLLAISLYVEQCSSYFPLVVSSSVSWYDAYLAIAHALCQKLSFQGSGSLLKSGCVSNCVCSGAYGHKIEGNYASVFAEQTKLSLNSYPAYTP